MAKTIYQVIHEGELIDERRTDRVYTHAVIVRFSAQYVLSRIYEFDSHDEVSYNYMTRFAGMTREQCAAAIKAEFTGRNFWRVEYAEKDLDRDLKNCNEFKAKHPSFNQWKENTSLARMEQFNRRTAEGDFKKFRVFGYCGRRELAAKLKSGQPSSDFYAEALIVDVVEKVKSKAVSA